MTAHRWLSQLGRSISLYDSHYCKECEQLANTTSYRGEPAIPSHPHAPAHPPTYPTHLPQHTHPPTCPTYLGSLVLQCYSALHTGVDHTVVSGRSGLLELNQLEQRPPFEARLQVKFCRGGQGEKGARKAYKKGRSSRAFSAQ